MNVTALAEPLIELLGRSRHLITLNFEEGLTVEVQNGSVSQTQSWAEGYATLQLSMPGGRVGYASAVFGSSGLDAADLLRRARETGTVTQPDRTREIRERLAPSINPRSLGIFDPSWAAKSKAARIDEAISRALLLEETAKGGDSRIASVRKPAFSAALEDHSVFRNGFELCSWRSTHFSLQVETAAQKGNSRESGWAAEQKRTLGQLSPKTVGEEARLRAVELLGAKKAPTGVFPAVFDRRVAAELLELLAPSLFADTHRKKTSLLQGKLGRKALSEQLTLIDDGLMPGGLETRPLDDEGTPCGRTVCVERGVITNLLYDNAEAAKAGAKSTGNGFGGQTAPPCAEITNFHLPNGPAKAESLVSLMGSGFFVREVLGLHTADPISGDFSVGASGFWVKNGRIAHPVSGAMISGNLLTLLNTVEAVADDLDFIGSVGSPSLLAGALQVAGG